MSNLTPAQTVILSTLVQEEAEFQAEAIVAGHSDDNGEYLLALQGVLKTLASSK